jgi:hypothetical protein
MLRPLIVWGQRASINAPRCDHAASGQCGRQLHDVDCPNRTAAPIEAFPI